MAETMTGDASATTTFAVAFAEALEDLGVRHAFGVSGGAISFFWSALGGTGIEVTHFRHESGAAFAACEASIASGAPVVVFVTTGPGLTNVLSATIPNPADRWTYHYKNQKSQIDYLLASNALPPVAAGIERRGIFGVAGVERFDTVTADTNAASDHAAVWGEFEV